VDNDDLLVGRLLSRREMLALLGGAGLALVVGCSDDDSPDATPTSGATQDATSAATAGATSTAQASGTAVPSCVVVPELTEGPYFVDGQLERSDITVEPSTGDASAGAPMSLTVAVSSVGGDGSCAPLQGAIVDVWHCDALGVYSGVSDPLGGDTTGQQLLRGYQVTGADGTVNFSTVYPGWYPGRATHIHFKIRSEDGYEYTSQWFFDDALSDQVHANAPYDKGTSGRTQNSEDGIFQGSGDQLTLDVQASGGAFAATFAIGLQMT
jgi:protocatechuate 3,4-dioxygenase beta subunit